MKADIKKLDMPLLLCCLVLLILGFIQLYSSSYLIASERFGGAGFFVINQFQRFIVGLFIGCAVFFIDYKKIISLAPGIYVVAVILLIAVLMPGSREISNVRRWISIGGFAVQVSELGKIGLILILSKVLSSKQEGGIRQGDHFMVAAVMILIVAVLVAAAPDFSSSVFIALAGFSLLYIGGARKKHLLYVLMASFVPAMIFLHQGEYRVQRLFSFFNRDAGQHSSNYQLNQAVNAIGSGGVFGQGIGEGMQKRYFLPETHTDFIFASFAEEFGFIGVLILFLCFFCVFVRGFRIAKYADHLSGTYLAVGLTLFLATNFVAHTAVNIGFIPTTGIPLPFMSFGGMNLIITLFSVAVLLNIGARSTEKPL
ncbi:MAG: FtsW/RodA/SpoVE family cell cycle protein [Fibrobacterota bacterium]